jgi:hypothetical protein
MKSLKRRIIPPILCMAAMISHAQNLVPNSSFEIRDTCPQNFSKVFYALPWFQPHTYNGNVINSCNSDLYDSCCTSGQVDVPLNSSGYQLPRSGKAYSGIFCNADTANKREYIEVQLLSPLISGKEYCVEFFVSLSDQSKKSINRMGMYFSNDSLLDASVGVTIDYVTPQIENDSTVFLNNKTTWMEISGSFIALGGGKYLTIGNFKTPTNTGLQNVPGGSTDYVYYYIDDISVMPCEDTATTLFEIKNYNSFILYPNPNNGNMILEYVLLNEDAGILEITDITGKILNRYELKAGSDKLRINDAQLENGLYLYRILVNNKVMKSDKLLIIK